MRNGRRNERSRGDALCSTEIESFPKAEQLFNAGQVAACDEFVADHLKSHPGSAVQAKLLIVQGMARFELGRVTDSFISLRASLELAEEIADRSLQFAAAFALFSRESQFQSSNEGLPGLSKLRALASAIGDANSLGALHLVVARLEACRGYCINARRHADLGRHLFSTANNVRGRTTIELIDSALEIHGGNIGRAMRSAQTGLMLSHQAGLLVPKAGCLTNLGSMLLFSGRVQESRELLQSVLSISSDLLLIRLSALDGMAQGELADGNLEACSDFITACQRTIERHHLPARSWYDLAHQLTRCAYHERLGDWARIVEICAETEPECARRQYKAIRTALLCARARALARLGEHVEADDALTTAVRTCPRGAVDPLIVLEASKGLCLSARGTGTTGTIHFDRALAACRAIGHRHHEAWVTALQDDVARAARGSVATPARALSVTDTAFLVTDIATILGAGHSIGLIAHRTASLLEGTSLRSRVDVQDESGCEYVAEPAAACETHPDGTFAIRLRGSDRRVTIRVRGVRAIDEISLLKSIGDIVQTAVSRTADDDSEDDDQTLWPRGVVTSSDDTVFQSPRMIELLRIAVRLASTELPILITGETGTGKEIFARLIHEHSRVKRGPFVPFNCSATPRELVESQLFGHRRGAFTGATESFPGVIRAAEHGTLFLDELGDLDAAAQPKLLRFLESGEIHPVGDARPVAVRVRTVAATNANIETLVDQGRFRRDLFYRISAARLSLPPLRERKDEIPTLASVFLTKCSRECARAGLRLGDDFIAALLLYDWPGNIREFANEMRRVVALSADGDTLTSANLAPAIVEPWNARPTSRTTAAPGVHIRFDQTLARATAELEHRFIEHAMRSSGGRVADAAQLLGLSRKGLFLKRRRRGLVARAGAA